MKHFFKPVFSLAIFAILASVSVQADSQEQMIIALKTTDFELTETDISELAVGEAKTIETDSGKVIDILRTAEGAEIYIDGELLELNFDNDGQHDEHMVKKHFEVICEEGQECDENVIVLGGQDHHGLDLVGEHENMIFIHKEVELSCTDDEEGTSCRDEHIWISDGEESEFAELHKMHQDGEGHKLIVIRKEIVTED
jgi:hypothetical protein